MDFDTSRTGRGQQLSIRERSVRLLPGLLGAAIVAATLTAVVPAPAGSIEPSPGPVVPSSQVAQQRPIRPSTPEGRGAALRLLITEELRAAEIPQPAIEIIDGNTFLGQFDGRRWSLQLSSAALTDVEVRTWSDFVQLAGAARHEARHAEQWFRIAQLLASQGRSATTIATELSLPSAVAAAAVAHPLAQHGDVVEATRWWDSIYGAGNEHRTRVLAELLAAKKAYDDAVVVYRSHPSLATGTAMQQSSKALEPAYARYRALPEEADAFRAQERLVATLHDSPVGPAGIEPATEGL